MKIVALVENTSKTNLKPVHGLSLYIETKKHRLLFDLGPDETLFYNAKLKNIDLSLVDTVIISHGHNDHGGALKSFLELNKKAKIYIQRDAFLPHHNILRENSYIGLDRSLISNPQLVLLDGNFRIDSELYLFKVKDGTVGYSNANDSLYEGNIHDEFNHEQNLVIEENKNVLIMGCGHKGIINILREAPKLDYSLCVGGFHLYNRKKNLTAPKETLDLISAEINKHKNTEFYTCHCTGIDAYNYLKDRASNLKYLGAGEEIEI